MRDRAVVLVVAALSFAAGCGGEGDSAPGPTTPGAPPVEGVDSPKYTGYYMPSSSMEPTLHCAKPAPGCEGEHPDRLVVEPLARDPVRGDIVAFRAPRSAAECGRPGAVWIKRVIALPGETWSQDQGRVMINGKLIAEPYVPRDGLIADTFPVRSVPEGMYIVLGDNRGMSCDSRRWGFLPREAIVGRVVKVYRQE